MRKTYFLTILAVMAAFVVCLPFDMKVTPRVAKALTTSATVGIAGNSVLTRASRCDQDSRTIAQMLTGEIQQPVLDLSFAGQSIDAEVVLAMAAFRNPKMQTVVLPLSVFQFFEWDTEPIRNYLLSRLVGPQLHLASLTERAASPGRFSGESYRGMAPFDYKGRHYPDYDHIKSIYFDREKRLMPCPEQDGADLDFVEAINYQLYVKFPVLDDDVALVASLGNEATRLGKSLQVVLLPIDFQLIERLDGPGAAALRVKTAALVAALRGAELNVLDLSADVPNDGFGDRYCACGHLLATGRATVANQIAQRLAKPAAIVTAK